MNLTHLAIPYFVAVGIVSKSTGRRVVSMVFASAFHFYPYFFVRVIVHGLYWKKMIRVILSKVNGVWVKNSSKWENGDEGETKKGKKKEEGKRNGGNSMKILSAYETKIKF